MYTEKSSSSLAHTMTASSLFFSFSKADSHAHCTKPKITGKVNIIFGLRNLQTFVSVYGTFRPPVSAFLQTLLSVHGTIHTPLLVYIIYRTLSTLSLSTEPSDPLSQHSFRSLSQSTEPFRPPVSVFLLFRPLSQCTEPQIPVSGN